MLFNELPRSLLKVLELGYMLIELGLALNELLGRVILQVLQLDEVNLLCLGRHFFPQCQVLLQSGVLFMQLMVQQAQICLVGLLLDTGLDVIDASLELQNVVDVSFDYIQNISVLGDATFN